MTDHRMHSDAHDGAQDPQVPDPAAATEQPAMAEQPAEAVQTSRAHKSANQPRQKAQPKPARHKPKKQSAGEFLTTDIAQMLRGQRQKDSDNDSLDTGTFPVVRKKPERTRTQRTLWQRIITSCLIIVLCMLLGFGYVTQLRSASDNYESLSEDELVRLLDETNTQVDRLEEQRTQLSNQVASITNATDKQRELNAVAKKNATTSGILAGRLGCEGQGITVTVTETGTTIEAARLFTLVEELRNAGAEAIAFNGVRIVASSYIVDTDEGIEADGQLVTSPYEFKAIGDPNALSNAIQISGGIGAQLRVRYNANVVVRTQSSVVIDELASTKNYQYAKIVE